MNPGHPTSMKISRLCLLLLLGIAVIPAYAQTNSGQKNKGKPYFEGKVINKITCKSKVSDISDEMLQNYIGDSSIRYVKEGSYKNEYPAGHMFSWTIVKANCDTMYSLRADSDTLILRDIKIADDTTINVEIRKNSASVLDMLCDEVIITSTKGIHRLFYNNRYPLNPQWFTKHQFGHFNSFTTISHSIVLKEVMELPNLTLTFTAIAIYPEKLSSNTFLFSPDYARKMATE